MLNIFLTGQVFREQKAGVKNRCEDIEKALPNAAKG